MTKRVSITGQGANIFFGDEAREPRPDSSDSTKHRSTRQRSVDVRSQKSKTDSKTLRPEEGQTDIKTAREKERQQDSQPSVLPVAQPLRLERATKERLLDLLGREHRTHNTFRYHEEELAAVRDIVYEMEVRRHVKITRNDVMRVALNWLIEDYRARGEDSLLVELFKEGA